MYRWMYRWMLQWESDGVVMITRRPHTCGRASAVARQKEESVTIRVRIYIHTYILFSACLTTRKFSNESSEDTCMWYRIPSHSAKSCLWPSSLTHANATYQYCHPAMPHLAVLAEERAKRGRFSDAAETIDHAPIQSLQEHTISSIITSSTAAKRPYITTSFLGPHSSQRRCSHARLRYGAAELGRLASR